MVNLKMAYLLAMFVNCTPSIRYPNRPAGLGITVSIKFRSVNADPTLRFQKFLRDSEKLLSMDIDKPGTVKYER